jgi:hypothetical protein
MSTHSPAPWTALIDPPKRGVRRSRMNGHLIAAAVDLLEALRAALPVLEQTCEGQHPDNVCCHALRQVIAAIAKAEGKS